MSKYNIGSGITYTIRLCTRDQVKAFIEEHHYSHSINGLMSSYCFGLFTDNVMVGGMIYGKLGMANAWKKYNDDIDKVLELRRLVLIDDTPGNSESFFLGATLKWLKNNTTIDTIVSYADPNYGHSGIIYKAANFVLSGMTSKGRVIMWNGKKYHDKAIRTKYKGELKPFAVKLKEALANGQAYYINQEPKYIYTYSLSSRRKRYKHL